MKNRKEIIEAAGHYLSNDPQDVEMVINHIASHEDQGELIENVHDDVEPWDGLAYSLCCEEFLDAIGFTHEGWMNVDEGAKRKIENFQDVKDMAVVIVGDLVLAGLVPDCTDTDDETEFEFQDAVVASLCTSLGITNEDEDTEESEEEEEE